MKDLEKLEADFVQRISRLDADDSPRAEHQAALRQRALAAWQPPRAAESLPMWRRTWTQGRTIMRRPVPRLLAMSVPCVLLLAGWIFLREEKSAAAAFHTFAHALVTAKTARFQMEVTIPGQPRTVAKSMFMAPASFRQDFDDNGMVNISDMQVGKIVNLNSKLKTAMVISLTGRPGNPASMDLFERLRDMLAERDLKDSSYKPVGEKEIDGRRTLGFRQETPMATVTLWGDPETGLPVQINTVMSGASQIDVIWSDFELNVELDKSLFDTTPPADYQVQSFEMDASPYEEQDLIETLRLATEIDDGKFPDSLDTETSQKLVMRSLRAPKDRSDEENLEKFMSIGAKVGRGFSFALQLPESADAHYAGKGVTRDAKNTPIFWYKPEGSKTFRVIDADLTTKDMDTAPEVLGAVPVYKSSLPAAAPQAEPK